MKLKDLKKYGRVAQTVEQLVEAQCVGGAIPSPSTNYMQDSLNDKYTCYSKLGTNVPVLLLYNYGTAY